MTRAAKRRHERRLRKLKIVPTNFKLTAASGLGTMLEIFDQTPLAQEFKACLPERVSPRSVGSYFLGLMVVASHIYGVNNLTGIGSLRRDPLLETLFGDEMAAIRTIGDFLADFEPEHIEKLNRFLTKMARTFFYQFQQLLPEQFSPQARIIDIDSTYHVQYGDQTEGANWNYKWQWSLETQVAFDQMGLCYGLQLRPGNTKSGVDADQLIKQCLSDSRTQKQRRMEALDYARMDSAYCTQAVIRECLELGALFTITANDATTKWKSRLDKEALAWQPWQWSEEDLRRSENSGRSLPQVEVARFIWRPTWGEDKVALPVVVKRTWKTFDEIAPEKQGNLFYQESIKNDGEWQYYAVVTNFDLSRWSIQEIFEHHQKRGHSENFIKEEKYGFNLKKFPCQKMTANHAWALLAQVAHNLVRWAAVLENPDKPHFSKQIRKQLIHIPGKVMHRSRQYFLQMSEHYCEEVNRLRERLQSTLKQPAYAFG